MSDSDNKQGKSLSRAKIIMILGIVASIVLMADILLLWHDGFVGIMLSAYLFWLIIPSFIVFLIAFVKSFKRQTGWHKAMLGCGLVVFLFFFAYALFRVPQQRCNPDIMAKHYEKHKTEMVELCEYMQSALADSTAVTLGFDGNELILFQVSAAGSDGYNKFWNENACSKRDSLMTVVGLTEEEFENIRNQLKTIGCIAIEASRTNPKSTTIHFREVGFAVYCYILYDRPMNNDEKEQALNDDTLIPYNDHTLFWFIRGAVGADAFSKEAKEHYLEKFQPW